MRMRTISFYRWWQATQSYRRPALFAMLLLGFASGLPLALSFQTLSLWLFEDGLDLGDVVMFSLAGLPYTLKFVWAPFIDRLSFPVLGRALGQRRGWLLASQISVMGAIVIVGIFASAEHPLFTAMLVISLTFASATQDIVVDAYRIDRLSDEEQALGAAMVIYGYRVGMLVSGGLGLILADLVSWTAVYVVMAGFMLVGILTTLMSKEPDQAAKNVVDQSELVLRKSYAARHGVRWAGILAWLHVAVWQPLEDIILRKGWWAILLTVVLYRIGNSLESVTSNLFLVEHIGFSKTQVGLVVKGFGLVSLLTGVGVGAILLKNTSMFNTLLICGVLQILSIFLFIVQAWAGPDMSVLAMTITGENFATGMSSVAFVAFTSIICNKAFSASQFALLSSLGAVPRTVLSSKAGVLVEMMGWIDFFAFAMVAAVPGVLLLFVLRKYNMGIPVPLGTNGKDAKDSKNGGDAIKCLS
ncbi:MAG: MFS transporter [Alphaproteobacteria bacterium]|nr:MAG: MFS transporter [Alphaproteobacteria bacterium]